MRFGCLGHGEQEAIQWYEVLGRERIIEPKKWELGRMRVSEMRDGRRECQCMRSSNYRRCGKGNQS